MRQNAFQRMYYNTPEISYLICCDSLLRLRDASYELHTALQLATPDFSCLICTLIVLILPYPAQPKPLLKKLTAAVNDAPAAIAYGIWMMEKEPPKSD
jgi:hypothetical protein